jgi:undecaprenyl-diphosphatase
MSSFPSGHAMIVFSIVPFLMKNFPKQKYYFILLAVLVAFSRIYLNVHYLSDIVAGAFLGYLIGVIFSDLEDKYGWK